MTTIYNRKGFENRKDYLEQLSEDYGISYYFVKELAELLGENEDFDGLITALHDETGEQL